MSNNFEKFGKYVLLEKVATGGMAEVYLGKSTGASGVSKFFAIKRILPQFSDNPEFVDMFKEEAKIAVNLSHSNVVSIFDFGIERGQFFLVMEYVEGQNLRQVLNFIKKQNVVLNTEQIVYVIKEVAAGLDHAHRCLDAQTGRPLNITHRDISPQNVMVSFEGDIKIVDFGIAKAESQLENTRAGTIKGKFGYMSPEQAEGSANVDLRTDIFSLGILLWEMLANDRLFVSNNEVNTLRKIRDCQIPSLRKINPNIPADLEKICVKALAKDPMLRYQTAAALNRDLSRFLSTQYPDFATQDFSIFMKTLFAAKISDNRRRFIDYSQSLQGSSSNEEHTQTATITHSGQIINTGTAPPPLPDPKSNPNLLDIDTSTKLSVDLENIKATSVPQKPARAETVTKSYTQPSPRLAPKLGKGKPTPYHQVEGRSNNSKLIAAGLALVISAAGLWTYLENPAALRDLSRPKDEKMINVEAPPPIANNDLETTPQPIVEASVQPPTPAAAVTTTEEKNGTVVHIQSEPSRARIFIDNRDTGLITPGRITVQANTPFI
ncbi:MAG: serine/threonine protein kinase, partial [Pseudobdellovibrionaceae bacterium]